MSKYKILEQMKQPNVFILLMIIILSGTLLIFINYYTIKILNADRAYVNGESHYSKAQKEATRFIITYLYTQDKSQWTLFKKELSVPQGDGFARISMTHDGTEEEIKTGLRAGRNNEKDLDDMIWLFKNFHSVSFLRNAIVEWKKADPLIDQLATVGEEIHQKVVTEKLTPEVRDLYYKRISKLSGRLTVHQGNFSNELGKSSRIVKNYLFYANVFFILLIISSVGIYYAIMVKKLLDSKEEIEIKNKDLTIVNKELDHFVHSASHDLRSPITSLKGLIEVIRLEDDLEKIRGYLDLMDRSLIKQDQFISDIIDYSKNKRKELVIESVSLCKIIDGALDQLHYIKGAKSIAISKQLDVDYVFSDRLRLKIVINNLLSNAVKYSDDKKKAQFIAIKTYWSDGFCVIEIEDNGIGIMEQYHHNIFEMFFVTNSNTGSGLGLYIVKEAVENMNGSITVTSEIKKGSKFTVRIPQHYEG